MSSFADINFESIYGLFKGEPGLRKSTCALSFPKPQFWFSWDMKMDALALPMRKWGIHPKDIQYQDYKDWDKAKAQLEKFQLNCPFATLIIDSITSGADAINRQTLKVKGQDNSGKKIAGIPVNSIEDFNAEDSALKELVAITKDIREYNKKVNIILIGHIVQKEVKTPGGQTHMARILVTAGKSIAQKIPAYCSEVYHFNIKRGFDADTGGQYALLTEHTGDDFGRSSLELPSEIVFGNEPLYEKWVEPALIKMQEWQKQFKTQPPQTPQQTNPFNVK